MSEFNNEYASTVICPWCGYQAKDPLEMFFQSEDDAETECECPECEKEFTAIIGVSLDYSTYKKVEGEK